MKNQKGFAQVAIILLNTLAIGVLLSLVIYTQIIYHKPIPREYIEKAKVQAELEKELERRKAFKPVFVDLDPLQTPIAPQRGTSGAPIQKIAKFKLSLELVDGSYRDAFNLKKTRILDSIQRELGVWQEETLISTQGRFILREKIVGLANEILRTKPEEPNIVTRALFTDFLVQ